MRNLRIFIGLALTLCAAMAVGKTWYGTTVVTNAQTHLPDTWAIDQEGTDAEAQFIVEYNAAIVAGNVKEGDLVDMSYSDGTVMEWTIGPLVNKGHPFNAEIPPKPVQGKFAPKGRPPVVLNILNGTDLTVAMSLNPTQTSIVYIIEVYQIGGGCDGCSSSGGGVIGDGGGGGTDPAPPPCTDADCGKGDD